MTKKPCGGEPLRCNKVEAIAKVAVKVSRPVRSMFKVGVLMMGFCSVTAFAAIDSMTQHFFEPTMAAFKQNFPSSFKVWSPSVKQHMLTLKYACPMRGKNISPAIAWKGVPAHTQRIHLTIEDGVCTWGCDARGKADHWILDFPVSAMKKRPFTSSGLIENAGASTYLRKYTYPNASGKSNYFGMCSPVGEPHAWVIQLTAYYRNNHGRVVVTGKTQSVPFLFPRRELK